MARWPFCLLGVLGGTGAALRLSFVLEQQAQALQRGQLDAALAQQSRHKSCSTGTVRTDRSHHRYSSLGKRAAAAGRGIMLYPVGKPQCW